MSETTTSTKSGNVKFGLVPWDSKDAYKNSGKSKDLFLRLESGSNVVRVLTEPHEYLSHRYKPMKSDPGYGDKVMSSMFYGRDVLVEKGLPQPKKRWLVGVVDRKSGAYKLLDVPWGVIKQIKVLANDDDWGPPTGYDIDIKVDKNAAPADYYSVLPKSKTPMSAKDLELLEKVDLEDLKRRCTPPTVEEMENLVKSVDAKYAAKRGSPANSDSDDDDDDDSDFPSVD